MSQSVFGLNESSERVSAVNPMQQHERKDHDSRNDAKNSENNSSDGKDGNNVDDFSGHSRNSNSISAGPQQPQNGASVEIDVESLER